MDTHCHITMNDYDDISSLIDKIKDSGVSKIIVNGCDIESNIEVLELVKKYDIVYGALGFHPTELDDFNDEYLSWLDEHIDDDKIVALGEIGLDYHYDNTDKNNQIDMGDAIKIQRYMAANNNPEVAQKHPDWLVVE